MNVRDKKRIRFIGKILFVLYIAFIIYFLIFSDWYGRSGVTAEYRYNLVLFREIKRFWQYREQLGMFAMFTNLFGNVLIFMPFGFFMPVACKNRRFFSAFFYSFGLSLCVETFQLVAKVGSFDVDDLLLNTVGGAAGYVLYAGCNAIRRRYVYQKTKEFSGRQRERACKGEGKAAQKAD